MIRSDHSVVAVDGCRNTRPDALTVVAALDQGPTTRHRIVHRVAFTFAEYCRIPSFAASHRSVVVILCESIGQAIANEDRLEVDITLLVAEDLRGKDGDVVSSVGFACDVEILMGIFGVLLEKEGEKSVDVLSCRNGVTDRTTAVGKASVNRLIKEDHRCIRVP